MKTKIGGTTLCIKTYCIPRAMKSVVFLEGKCIDQQNSETDAYNMPSWLLTEVQKVLCYIG